MKTTLELSPPLLALARRLAAERGLSLREVIERALATRIRQRSSRPNVRLHDLAWGSGGLVEPYRWDDWESLKEAGRESPGE